MSEAKQGGAAAAAEAKTNKIRGAISTKRKRGADPSEKSVAAETTKSTTTSKSSSSSWSLKAFWRSKMPSYMQKRPPSKMLIDFAVFTAGAVFIYKFGGSVNSFI